MAARRLIFVQVGVWMGVPVSHWVSTHPNAHVVGVDTFEKPIKNHSSLRTLPGHVRSRFRDTSKGVDFRMGLADFVVKQNADEERAILVQAFSPEATISELSNAKLVTDLLFFSGDPGDDHHSHSIFLGGGCANYLNNSLSVFFNRNPKGYVGGVDWQLYPCLQDTARAFAAERRLELIVMHKCAWVLHNDLTWVTHVSKKTFKHRELPTDYKGDRLSVVVAKYGKLIVPTPLPTPVKANRTKAPKHATTTPTELAGDAEQPPKTPLPTATPTEVDDVSVQSDTPVPTGSPTEEQTPMPTSLPTPMPTEPTEAVAKHAKKATEIKNTTKKIKNGTKTHNATKKIKNATKIKNSTKLKNSTKVRNATKIKFKNATRKNSTKLPKVKKNSTKNGTKAKNTTKVKRARDTTVPPAAIA